MSQQDWMVTGKSFDKSDKRQGSAGEWVSEWVSEWEERESGSH